MNATVRFTTYASNSPRTYPAVAYRRDVGDKWCSQLKFEAPWDELKELFAPDRSIWNGCAFVEFEDGGVGTADFMAGYFGADGQATAQLVGDLRDMTAPPRVNPAWLLP